MRKAMMRTIAVATTAAIAASGTAAAGFGGNDSRGGGFFGGSSKRFEYATVKYPTGQTLVLFGERRRKDVQIRGLASGERVVGIDVRPATGALYGVSSANRVFTIDTSSGQIGDPRTLTTALNGAFFGVDFNPAVDRLRIVSDTEQNLRVNVADGATTTDTPLAYPAGDRNAGKNPAVGAVGYTFAPLGGPTALYDVDSANDNGGANGSARPDTFTLQNPPNGGGLQSIGPIGIDITAQGGFDIAGKSRFEALGFYQQGGVARLYEHRFDENGRVRPTRVSLSGQYDGFAVLDGYRGR